MMNNVAMVGRLTADPEIRYTQNGTPVGGFTLAVDRRFKKEGQPTADFIPVVVWGKLAEVVGNNMAKGRRVGVTGRLQQRSYETKEGQKRTVIEVVAEEVDFLDSKKQHSSPAQGGGVESMGRDVFPDEEIPF